MYTATCDPLCSEGRAYADELEAAGVAVERMEVDGAIHGVFSMTLDCGFAARDAAGRDSIPQVGWRCIKIKTFEVLIVIRTWMLLFLKLILLLRRQETRTSSLGVTLRT